MSEDNLARRTIDVLIDESKSGGPTVLLLAGGIAFETDLGPVDRIVQKKYEELSGSFYLEGQRSFEKFRRNGFHAKDDIPAVSIAFVQTISKLYGIRLFIECSDKVLRPDLSDYQTIALLETRIAETVLRKYRHYDGIRFIFEENPELNKHFESIVSVAVRRTGFRGDVEVKIGGKKEPHALAIVDYALASYRRQLPADAPENKRLTWKAMQPMVSSVRYLDRGGAPVLRRGVVK